MVAMPASPGPRERMLREMGVWPLVRRVSHAGPQMEPQSEYVSSCVLAVTSKAQASQAALLDAICTAWPGAVGACRVVVDPVGVPPDALCLAFGDALGELESARLVRLPALAALGDNAAAKRDVWQALLAARQRLEPEA